MSAECRPTYRPIVSTNSLLTKTRCRPTLGRHISRVSVDLSAECQSLYRPIVSTGTRSTDALSTQLIQRNNGLLNSFCSFILLQLESLNFWEFGYFLGGGTFVSKLPTFKTLFAFVVLTLFKLPDPGASIYVQSFLKFPTWGAQGCSKSPPRPVVPPRA